MSEANSTEIWKTIDGLCGTYQVSNIGRIRSVHENWGDAYVMKPQINTSGYPHIRLKDGNGNRPTLTVHRLVAAAFIGKPPDGRYDINHINGKKTDNRVENLEYCSRSENLKHAYNILKVRPYGGENHPNHRRIDIDRIMALHAEGLGIKRIAKATGYPKTTVGRVLRKEHWQQAGNNLS